MSLRDIVKVLTGRDANPRHEENALDADWQAGYFTGMLDESTDEEMHPITVEWIKRKRPNGSDAKFIAWKRGYHAGRFTKIEKTRPEYQKPA